MGCFETLNLLHVSSCEQKRVRSTDWKAASIKFIILSIVRLRRHTKHTYELVKHIFYSSLGLGVSNFSVWLIRKFIAPFSTPTGTAFPTPHGSPVQLTIGLLIISQFTHGFKILSKNFLAKSIRSYNLSSYKCEAILLFTFKLFIVILCTFYNRRSKVAYL